MGLYERITGEETPRISAHDIAGIMGEWERGQITQAEALAVLDQGRPMNPQEISELNALFIRCQPRWQPISLGSGPVALTNVGTAFDGIPNALGLGVVRLFVTGISSIIFDVRAQKVGSGTQEWQLWNDTDAAQVALIQDTQAAGVHNLTSGEIEFVPPLTGGFKMARVRARSSVAADDPVFLGASLAVRYVGILTALEIHEVLLLGGRGTNGPYQTAADIKARLGVT